MAQYDIPFLQRDATTKYDFRTITAAAGGILGFNPTTRVPENVGVLSYNAAGDLVLADGADVVLNATTGTKVGSAVTEKLGFWGKTPIVQPSGANQAALTDSTTGVAAFTLVDVTAAHDQTKLNANFASVARLLNQLRTDLVNSGLIKGSA
jgi:hypothetical protein